MNNIDATAVRPLNVPPHLVVDFDIFRLGREGADMHATLAAYQKANPGIFWTPHNGGHWVVTGAADIETMQRDYRRFSHRRVTVPPAPAEIPPAIPLELDPPIHNQYRRPLMEALQPGKVREMDQQVRQIAIDAIECFRSRGECEFVSEFAQVLPIHIFLDMVNLPREDKVVLVPVVNRALRAKDYAERAQGHQAINEYLRPYIEERRNQPGTDLLSRIGNIQIDGERIGEEEALRYTNLLLFGGLDTVAAMLSFVTRYLAENPDQRRLLQDNLQDSAFINNAIEELLRRHGIAMTARVATQDMDFGAVHFLEGDMILPANVFVGLDEQVTENPLTIDLRRSKPHHAVFGNGAHACPGAILARRELRVFLEEWLTRIPEFSIRPGSEVVNEAGLVLGIQRLELIWPVASQ